MQVLVIGSGGREHALALKAAQDNDVENVYVSPGNAGTALEEKVQNIEIDINDFAAIENFCVTKKIGVVGWWWRSEVLCVFGLFYTKYNLFFPSCRVYFFLFRFFVPCSCRCGVLCDQLPTLQNAEINF